MEEKENNKESHLLSLEEHEKSTDFCEEGQSRTEDNSRKEKKKKRKKEKKEKKEKLDKIEKEKKKKKLEEGHMAVTENNEQFINWRGSENNDDDEKNSKKFNQPLNTITKQENEQTTIFCREEPCTVENNSKKEENKEGKDTNGRHSENNDEKKQNNEQYSPTRRNQYEQSTNFCREELCTVEDNSKWEESKEDKDTNRRHSENNDEKKQKNFNQTSNIIKTEKQSNQARRHEYEQSKCSYREEPNAVEGNLSKEKNRRFRCQNGRNRQKTIWKKWR